MLEWHSQKSTQKISDSLSLAFSWSIYFSKAVWLLNVAVLRRIHSFWSLLVNDEDKRNGELYRPILKIWDSTMTISGHDISFCTVTANTGQLAWNIF